MGKWLKINTGTARVPLVPAAMLFACGITWADMTARKVVELRTRQIIAQPVNTWAELHQLRKAA